MDGDDGFVSSQEATSLIRSNPSISSVRNYVDAGLLHAEFTVGGHRRIERASISALNEWLAMTPGKAKRAARTRLIEKNMARRNPGWSESQTNQ